MRVAAARLVIAIIACIFFRTGEGWLAHLQDGLGEFARGHFHWRTSLYSPSLVKGQAQSHQDRKPQVVVSPLAGPYPGWKWDEYLPRSAGEARKVGVPPTKGWQSLMKDEEIQAPDDLEWLAKSTQALEKDQPVGSHVSRFPIGSLPWHDPSGSGHRRARVPWWAWLDPRTWSRLWARIETGWWPWPSSQPWVSHNESQLTPLLPREVMWLIEEADERLNNGTQRFKLDTGETLAAIQSVSYCNFDNILAWNCTRCGGLAGSFETRRVVYDSGWDLVGFAGFSHKLNAMVVSFRGTDSHSIYNWAENMRYWRTDLALPLPDADGALVHTGFFYSYNNSALGPNMTDVVAEMAKEFPGKPLYVVGHSLGGAMATIAAVDLRVKLQLGDVYLYTFGSPRVGNEIFSKFVRKHVKESIRVTHNRDIVPSVPPTWVGFHHTATEVWIVEYEGAGVLGICDDSGEDPRCHNSVCYLGLCTSVTDHLHYFQANMYNGDPKC